jgi:hypothetical protein
MGNKTIYFTNELAGIRPVHLFFETLDSRGF